MTRLGSARLAVRRGLAGLRSHERAAVLLGGAFGLGLSLGHVAGLAIGGIVLGVASSSTWRAAGYGLLFGVVVWLTFASTLVAGGHLDAYLGMGQLTLLSVGAAFGLPLLGALAGRGLT